MKVKTFVSAMMLACASMGAVALVAAPAAVYAAEKTVSTKVGKPLQAAQEALKAKNPKVALNSLSEAEGMSGRTPYETYVLNQMKVQAYAQLGDNANLAKAAEAALATGQASAKEADVYKQAAAQGYLASGNVDKAMEFGKDDPNFKPLIAQAYLKKGQYAQAESTIREAINNAGGGAQEQWYLILQEAQRKSGDVSGANDTIATLLKSHPKPEYWKYVLGNLLNEKGLSDKNRLDIYRLIDRTNSFNDATDYTEAAEIAMVAKAPGDAKRFLDRGFKANVLGTGPDADRHKRLQATASARSAQDLQSVASIEGSAAAQPGGDALASIADSYLANGNYPKAASLYQSALGKGSLTDAAATKLHLGIAYAGAKQNDAALKAFNGVPGKGVVKELAGLWSITVR